MFSSFCIMCCAGSLESIDTERVVLSLIERYHHVLRGQPVSTELVSSFQAAFPKCNQFIQQSISSWVYECLLVSVFIFHWITMFLTRVCTSYLDSKCSLISSLPFSDCGRVCNLSLQLNSASNFLYSRRMDLIYLFINFVTQFGPSLL